MQKLTFLKACKKQVKGTGICISYDKVMGVIEALPEEMQGIMSNRLIVESFVELGATHWELSEVPNGKIELVELPDNFYNPIQYRDE